MMIPASSGKTFIWFQQNHVFQDKYFPQVWHSHVAGGTRYTERDVAHGEDKYREHQEEYPAGFDPFFE